MTNYRDYCQQQIYRVIDPAIRLMARAGITPNIVTFAGFLGSLAATVCFILAANGSISLYGGVMWGGIIILAASILDMFDGRLARVSGRSSTFGALWDSCLDRYSEIVTLFGISALFFWNGWYWSGVVTYCALAGSVMVSYVRARAEGLQTECKVGLMQRPERVVTTSLAAIVTGVCGSLWILSAGMLLIALLSNVTAFWRMVHCYKHMKDK